MARDKPTSSKDPSTTASNTTLTGSTGRRRFIQSAGAAGVLGLAGCMGGGSGKSSGSGSNGGKTSDGGTTKLKYWTLFGGGDGKVMKALTDQFNKEHDDIQIERQRIPWGEYYNKLYTSLTSGTAPDLAICHASRLRRMKDYLNPMPDIDLSQFLDVTQSQVQYDGKQLAAPLDIHAVANYYNKDIFKEAGLDPEKPPTDWKSHKDAMQTIMKETDYTAYDPGPNGFCFRTWLSWVGSAGEQFLKNESETPQPAFNNDTVIELTRPFDKMVSEWGWTTKTGDASFDAFNTGKHAVIMDGTWAYSRWKESAGNVDFDWGVYTTSVGPNKQKNMTSGDSHTLTIPMNPDRSKAKEQAARKAAEWFATNSYWPLNSGHIPSTKKVIDSDELRNSNLWDKTMHLFAKQAKNGNIKYEPATDKNGEYRRIMQQALIGIRTQNKDVETALSDAEAQLKRAFK